MRTSASMASAYRRSASPCVQLHQVRLRAEIRIEQEPLLSLRSSTRGAFTPTSTSIAAIRMYGSMSSLAGGASIAIQLSSPRADAESSGGSSRPRGRGHLEIARPEQLRQPLFELFEAQVARAVRRVREDDTLDRVARKWRHGHKRSL
jgi:hypothetical protein